MSEMEILRGRGVAAWVHDRSPFGLFTTDNRLIVTEWNQWLESRSERKHQEVIGGHLLDLYPDLVTRKMDHYFREALEGQTAVLSQTFHHYLLPMQTEFGDSPPVNMPQSAIISPLILDDQISGTVAYIEDVTERIRREKELIAQVDEEKKLVKKLKSSEEALTKSEVFLNATEKISKVGGWEIDGETQKVFWTKEIYNITEVPADYDPSSLEKEAIAFFNKEDQMRLLKATQRAFEHAEPYNMEFLITTAKGNKKWAQATCEPVVVDGKVVKLGGTFQDITERKQGEEALRESEKKYRQLVESTNDWVWSTDVNGLHTFSNQAVRSFLGYEPHEIIGKSAFKFIHPEDQNRIQKMVQQAVNHKKGWQIDKIRWLHQDGGIRHVESRAEPILDANGNMAGFQGIDRDVTEREHAVETLRESEEKYRFLVENANDAIFIAQDEAVKFPNPKSEEMTGYSAEELAKMPFINLIYPDDRDMVLDRHKRRLSGETLPETYDFRIINKAGETLWVDLNTGAISWGGRPATLNLLRDITQQKQLEAQLQQSQKLEAIGMLAGGVAHDLNNILSGIVSYPELIMMDLPEDSPLRKPISTIQKSGKKAAVIVQDLLTLARRGVAITEVANLNHIISEQLKSPEFENLLSFHQNVKIDTNLGKDLLDIKGSTTHLSKSLMNLISNAAEAMIDGGTIFISTENRYVDRPVKGYGHVKAGDYVIMTISDTGIGMSSEDMQKIFEPFYTKKAMGRSGTGLGMAVVWGTVKDHKGYIDLKSTKGKGTTFTLYFPVTRQEAAADRSLLSIEDYMGKGETILVIDDVEEQREIASVMLKKLGYSVTSVSNGEEAVEYMKNNTADLLVLDMIMDPGIDGLETYKRILKMHTEQKAIIASGYSETSRVKAALKFGAGAYVKKPYLIEKLGLIVRNELKK